MNFPTKNFVTAVALPCCSPDLPKIAKALGIAVPVRNRRTREGHEERPWAAGRRHRVGER